jgi:hypothetical protein
VRTGLPAPMVRTYLPCRSVTTTRWLLQGQSERKGGRDQKGEEMGTCGLDSTLTETTESTTILVHTIGEATQ